MARRQSLCKKQAPKNDVLNLENFVVRQYNFVRHHVCHLQPLMDPKDMTTITHHLVYESLVQIKIKISSTLDIHDGSLNLIKTVGSTTHTTSLQLPSPATERAPSCGSCLHVHRCAKSQPKMLTSSMMLYDLPYARQGTRTRNCRKWPALSPWSCGMHMTQFL